MPSCGQHDMLYMVEKDMKSSRVLLRAPVKRNVRILPSRETRGRRFQVEESALKEDKVIPSLREEDFSDLLFWLTEGVGVS